MWQLWFGGGHVDDVTDVNINLCGISVASVGRPVSAPRTTPLKNSSLGGKEEAGGV